MVVDNRLSGQETAKCTAGFVAGIIYVARSITKKDENLMRYSTFGFRGAKTQDRESLTPDIDGENVVTN